MPRVIFICPYLKGKGRMAARRQYYVKYIATRDGVEMMDDSQKLLPGTRSQQQLIADILKDFPETAERFEYEDYLQQPTRENASAFITAALEQNLAVLSKRENYVGYIARRPRAGRLGNHGLFSGQDEPIVLDQVAKQAAEHPGNMWMPIISLRREDAARLGYDNAANWRAFLSSYAANMAKGLKIHPDRFRWYAAYHDQGHHPHVHMVCWSADAKEGFLTKEGIREIKSGLATRIFRQELLHIYEQQTTYRDLLNEEAQGGMAALITRMEQGVLQNDIIENLMARLVEKLRSHKGKKQYGYLSAATKEIADRIVDELAKDGRVAGAYAKWCEMRMEVLRTYLKEPPHPGPLSAQKELKRIRNIVVEEAAKLAAGGFIFDSNSDDDFTADVLNEAELQELLMETSAFFNSGEPLQETSASLNSGAGQPIPWFIPYRKARAILRDEEKDVPKAVALFKQAAANEPAGFASFALGRMYLRGVDLPRDIHEAVRWLARSAGQGNHYACYALAAVYLNDQEIPKDIGRALPLLLLSAKAGNDQAMCRLGRLYLEGEDAPQDSGLAARFLTEAARRGNQYAQYALGKLYLMNNDIPRDREQARYWLEQSAEQGNEYARFLLGHCGSLQGPALFLAATRLLRHMGRIFRENPPTLGRVSGSDQKQRRKEREKKIALGHARDEHMY